MANRRHLDNPECSQAHGTGAMGSLGGGWGAVWGYAGADAWPKSSRVDSTCSKKHQSEPARAAEANRRHPGIPGCSLPHGIATLGAVGVMGALWALPALWPLKVDSSWEVDFPLMILRVAHACRVARVDPTVDHS